MFKFGGQIVDGSNVCGNACRDQGHVPILLPYSFELVLRLWGLSVVRQFELSMSRPFPRVC
jgi:hypothetical protein